ncbi:MAG: Uma2 family endonuclease [Tepidisphaeraceae bacterium]|jgi:Uma2 family endonuclease
MTVRTLRDAERDYSRVVPLTVEQYHEMIAEGILEEGKPIELIDGLLVRKDRSRQGGESMTVGYEHALVVQSLSELNELLKDHGCHMRTQNPITLPPNSEPEPDGALVRGDRGNYRVRHPMPADILGVVEVADSSLKDDRTIKQRLYADAGIALYVLINLVDHAIEVRTQPVSGEGRYAAVATLPVGQTLSLPLADGTKLEIPTERLLP